MSGDRSPGVPPGLVVRIAGDRADREECFAVRKEVFVGEQGIAEDIEYDAHDAEGASVLHVLALLPPAPLRFAPDGFDGTVNFGIPVGTGRLLHGAAAGDVPPGTGVLGRLAVVRHARGLGIGGAMVYCIEEAARQLGLTAVELHAQTHAVNFYTRLGYEAYGEEYTEAGIPHRAMRRTL